MSGSLEQNQFPGRATALEAEGDSKQSSRFEGSEQNHVIKLNSYIATYRQTVISIGFRCQPNLSDLYVFTESWATRTI